jgi:hypothetical protein
MQSVLIPQMFLQEPKEKYFVVFDVKFFIYLCYLTHF